MDNIHHKEALIRAIRRGNRPEYLLFWGHHGRNPFALLSQWAPAPFEVEGITYPTAEHWMMAEKARLFADREILEKILAAPSPAAAKRLGRKVSGFRQQVWNQHRVAIVVEGNRHKFEQDRQRALFLLRTGDHMLVEASPTDVIWGIGLHESDSRATDPRKWRGSNLLGFALMKVRDQLSGSFAIAD